MQNILLLPNRYKKLGWFILLPSTIMGLAITFINYEIKSLKFSVYAFIDNDFSGNNYFSIVKNNITDEIVALLFLIGAMLVAFSKEKKEDEFIVSLRLSSLLWAICINYLLLFIAIVFVYGFPFINVMIYNMFTVLIIFIIRFNYILYRNSKVLSDEK
jgi:hypothetical protein